MMFSICGRCVWISVLSRLVSVSDLLCSVFMLVCLNRFNEVCSGVRLRIGGLLSC